MKQKGQIQRIAPACSHLLIFWKLTFKINFYVTDSAPATLATGLHLPIQGQFLLLFLINYFTVTFSSYLWEVIFFCCSTGSVKSEHSVIVQASPTSNQPLPILWEACSTLPSCWLSQWFHVCFGGFYCVSGTALQTERWRETSYIYALYISGGKEMPHVNK